MRMKTARIGDCIVGDGHPCFISLEAGATHTGLQSALELVRAAADAGADAVKFQTILADELMADEDFEIAFESASGKSQESVYNALKRRELTLEEWAEVKAFCDRRGLLFISTPSGFETVDWLKKLGAAAIKVSKSDINHRVLIEYIAQQGLPVILDGRERFEDVETAARICEDAGVEDIVVMHCPSGYPAERAGIHLSAIKTIKETFGYPVAYSDHSVGEMMNYVALGIGVNFIEKTITLDRTTEAVEHFMSLEATEVKSFVEQIRISEAALGDPRVIFSSRVNKTLRRSLIAKRDIQVGETLGLDNVDFKRPGTHIPADSAENVLGKQAAEAIVKGTFLEWTDISE
jgi:N,N'-diacetyllegionaminate synthase